MTEKQLSWHATFMDIAQIMSRKSTCLKEQVGCVLIKKNRILSTGFNGTPSGVEHCVDAFLKVADTIDHGLWSKHNEVHAEINAIIDAGRRGTLKQGFDAYCTLFPCLDCVKALITAGVRRIIYKNDWDGHGIDMELAYDLCNRANVCITAFTSLCTKS